MTDQSPVELVTVEEVKAALENGNAQVVDIRPSFDFAGGRIPGSINMPNRSLATRTEQLDTSRRVLFVSEDGTQGEGAARTALSMGLTNVANIAGGLEAWLAAGYPVHTIDDGS